MWMLCLVEILRALVLECGIPATDVGTMRLQSSHCEACDFEAVVANIDHGKRGHCKDRSLSSSLFP